MAPTTRSTHRDALIGHSGLVGGILDQQHAFQARFNSRNISDAAGQRFDRVVCAAAPGSMFEANNFPERDRERVQALMDQLGRIDAGEMILISSIAVLADFAGGDDEETTAFQTRLAYGRHRRMLEAFCAERFERCLIVRLPALYGPGLRKNFLFDLLNPVPTLLKPERHRTLLEALPGALAGRVEALYVPDAQTGLLRIDRERLNADPLRPELEAAVTALGLASSGFHHPATTYQFYGLDRLWADIGVARAAGLSAIHLVTAPLRAGDIYRRLMGEDMAEGAAAVHHEDMRTRHASLWGRNGPYLEEEATVLDRLEAFFREEARA